MATPTMRLYQATSPAANGNHENPTLSDDPLPFTLDEFFSWDDIELEYRHDYIQHFFPLPETSQFHRLAPVLTAADRDAFAAQPGPRATLRRVFDRMCRFYGFDRRADDFVLVAVAGPAQRRWLCPMSHNHLRITRIIRCLRILGLEDDARAFHKALLREDAAGGGWIDAQTKRYWRRAALGAIEQPPNPRDGVVEWLKESAP